MNTVYFYFGKPIATDTASALLLGMRQHFFAFNEQNGQRIYTFSKFHLSIASGGGDVIAAFGLYNQVRSMKITIDTHNAAAVDSAALIPFLIGERRTASAFSGFMFHQMSWTFPSVAQTRVQIADVSGWLSRYDHLMATLISERSHLSYTEAQRMMKDGTNMTPQEALECGLIHAIEEFEVPRDSSTFQV